MMMPMLHQAPAVKMMVLMMLVLVTRARQPLPPPLSALKHGFNTHHRFDFDDDSDIDVVYGDETITLHYEEDLDDLATIRTDRTGVPDKRPGPCHGKRL